MSTSSVSLGRRLGNGLALQSFAVLAIVCLAVYGWTYLGYRSQRSDSLERQKIQLEHLFSEAREDRSEQLLRHKLDDMLVGNNQLAIEILKEDKTPYFQRRMAILDASGEMLQFSLPSPGQDDVLWDIRLSLDTKSEVLVLKKLAVSLMAAAMVGALLISVGGFILVRRGLRPLRNLIDQTRSFSMEIRDQRLDGSGQPAEVAPLVAHFNESLDRLHRAYDQLESFNADVAHELATPLTTLIGSTEIVLRKQRTTNELRQVLESNLEEFQRLTRIVQDMLFLARADHGASARRKPQQNLTALMHRVSAFHEAEIEDRQVSVAVRGGAPIAMDTALVERALSNLLSNAVRYATPKTEIQMVAEISNSEATVQVENFGVPIPPERQSQIFDRFYRSDASRSDAHLHHGLGLSIVAAIARMHGGRTFVQSTSQKTVIGFTLRIPVREVAHPENSAQRTLAYNIKEE